MRKVRLELCVEFIVDGEASDREVAYAAYDRLKYVEATKTLNGNQVEKWCASGQAYGYGPGDLYREKKSKEAA